MFQLISHSSEILRSRSGIMALEEIAVPCNFSVQVPGLRGCALAHALVDADAKELAQNLALVGRFALQEFRKLALRQEHRLDEGVVFEAEQRFEFLVDVGDAVAERFLRAV